MTKYDSLEKVISQMNTLGFTWRSWKGGGKFKVYFMESERSHDPIVQGAMDEDLLMATRMAAASIVDFINKIGSEWRTRPIKESAKVKPRGKSHFYPEELKHD